MERDDAPGAHVFRLAVVLDVPCGPQHRDELVADRKGVCPGLVVLAGEAVSVCEDGGAAGRDVKR